MEQIICRTCLNMQTTADDLRCKLCGTQILQPEGMYQVLHHATKTLDDNVEAHVHAVLNIDKNIGNTYEVWITDEFGITFEFENITDEKVAMDLYEVLKNTRMTMNSVAR